MRVDDRLYDRLYKLHNFLCITVHFRWGQHLTFKVMDTIIHDGCLSICVKWLILIVSEHKEGHLSLFSNSGNSSMMNMRSCGYIINDHTVFFSRKFQSQFQWWGHCHTEWASHCNHWTKNIRKRAQLLHTVLCTVQSIKLCSNPRCPRTSRSRDVLYLSYLQRYCLLGWKQDPGLPSPTTCQRWFSWQYDHGKGPL